VFCVFRYNRRVRVFGTSMRGRVVGDGITSIAVVERKELVAVVRQNTWLPRAADENMIDRHLL
jgi:hypothetical protein